MSYSEEQVTTISRTVRRNDIAWLGQGKYIHAGELKKDRNQTVLKDSCPHEAEQGRKVSLFAS